VAPVPRRHAISLITEESMRNVLHATLFALFLSAPLAHADDASPVGLWQTIDDVTHKPTALIRITEQNGQLQGRIDKLIVAPGGNPNPTCIACTGTLKNQPVVGLTILSGLKKDGASYSGGEILDPNNGKTYKSKLTVQDGGKKLDVRGYVGTPLLGRSQTWVRAGD
jgi:uncharacterized protein (DUF2147 family)